MTNFKCTFKSHYSLLTIIFLTCVISFIKYVLIPHLYFFLQILLYRTTNLQASQTKNTVFSIMYTVFLTPKWTPIRSNWHAILNPNCISRSSQWLHPSISAILPNFFLGLVTSITIHLSITFLTWPAYSATNSQPEFCFLAPMVAMAHSMLPSLLIVVSKDCLTSR